MMAVPPLCAPRASRMDQRLYSFQGHQPDMNDGTIPDMDGGAAQEQASITWILITLLTGGHQHKYDISPFVEASPYMPHICICISPISISMFYVPVYATIAN